MKMIGVAELKSRLSEYLTQVKAGEEILITDHGSPVAKVVPVESGHGDLDELVREGLASPGTGTIPDAFFDRKRPSADGPSVSDALIEDRRSGR